MSPSHPFNASPVHPSIINLNSLLVLAGACYVFTKFCLDKRLLSLQEIAKANRIGPIWCGASRNILVGYATNSQQDRLFSHFNSASLDRFRPMGFPGMLVNGTNRTTNFPWQERQSLRLLRDHRGRAANENKASESSSPNGFKILLEKYVFNVNQ